MANPFEDESAAYLVIVNPEGQYSLWPLFREVPKGWEVTRAQGSRKECLEWVEQHWTDMRPKSLVKSMEDQVSDSEDLQRRERLQ